MKQYKDGWHKIAGYEVYMEDGLIVRGMSDDRKRSVYVYRMSRLGGWDLEYNITPDAFRAGVRRGRIKMAQDSTLNKAPCLAREKGPD